MSAALEDSLSFWLIVVSELLSGSTYHVWHRSNTVVHCNISWDFSWIASTMQWSNESIFPSHPIYGKEERKRGENDQKQIGTFAPQQGLQGMPTEIGKSVWPSSVLLRSIRSTSGKLAKMRKLPLAAQNRPAASRQRRRTRSPYYVVLQYVPLVFITANLNLKDVVSS